MNTGLLTKENEFIPIPYYEIGAYAEEICKQYTRESELNKVQFEVFSKDYVYFKPYLDFLLFELGYKMISPLLNTDSMWCVENNKLVLKSNNKDKYYLPVCDRALGISYINPEDASDCMINQEGRTFKNNREFDVTHENICELVVNQYLIYDKELYDIYENSISNGIINVVAFAKNMLGFSQMVVDKDKSGAVVYCEDFYNSYLENIYKRMKEINPEFIIAPYKTHTKESLELANKCIERVGEMNENRRLRL